MANFIYDDGGRAASGFRGKTGDCAVRALAIALEANYDDVYKEIKALMHDERYAKCFNAFLNGKDRTPRRGVPMRILRDYLASRGWHWHATMRIGSGCRVHLRENELPKGRVIARCSRHLVTLVDGVLHDIFDASREGTRCVYGYWTKD